jgi:hypothetical protein
VRAFELAKINLTNRPTLRAFEQAHAAAVSAQDHAAANHLKEAAGARWGRIKAFQYSSLSTIGLPRPGSTNGPQSEGSVTN